MKWLEMTTDQKSAHIRDGVRRNLSARQIGEEVGTSRNAIIGHSGRHGCQLRRPLVAVSASRKRRPHPLTSKVALPGHRSALTGLMMPNSLGRLVQAEAPVAAVPMPARPTCQPVSLLSRATGIQCSFIEGDPIPFASCCGAPVQQGTEWCPWHRRIVYGRAA